ncbi:hypothetical protein [Chromobacterium sp. CV08]|uniref:hypothetical protein n=1 Tax=Chromobacterium sp. CV08 TaxID=3133274 RepID=UPI003DA9319F
MTWHIEDDVGVIIKGSEASCAHWMRQTRQKRMQGHPSSTRGTLRMVDHRGLVVACLLDFSAARPDNAIHPSIRAEADEPRAWLDQDSG